LIGISPGNDDFGTETDAFDKSGMRGTDTGKIPRIRLFCHGKTRFPRQFGIAFAGPNGEDLRRFRSPEAGKWRSSSVNEMLIGA
jgi:hypothetical protein